MLSLPDTSSVLRQIHNSQDDYEAGVINSLLTGAPAPAAPLLEAQTITVSTRLETSSVL